MTDSEFQDYWLIRGEKITSYSTVEQRVLAGATAIEISAERQREAAEAKEKLAEQGAIANERMRQAAAQQAHERSPEGMREAAIRTAKRHPGGIVNTAIDTMDELDAFGPAMTNLLR